MEGSGAEDLGGGVLKVLGFFVEGVLERAYARLSIWKRGRVLAANNSVAILDFISGPVSSGPGQQSSICLLVSSQSEVASLRLQTAQRPLVPPWPKLVRYC